jgi:hypothetical protein
VLKRSTVITRLRTDEGLVSEIYNGDNREHGREIVRLIHEELVPRVLGLDLFEHLRDPPRVSVFRGCRSHRSPAPPARHLASLTSPARRRRTGPWPHRRDPSRRWSRRHYGSPGRRSAGLM